MPLDCVEARENFRKNELQTGNQSGRSDNNQGDDRHRPRLAAREPIQLKRATQGTDGHHESAQQPANELDFLEHLSNLTRQSSATASEGASSSRLNHSS